MDTWPDLRKSTESFGQSTAESEQPCGFPDRSSRRLLIRRSLVRAQVEEPNLRNPPLRDGGFFLFRRVFRCSLRGDQATTTPRATHEHRFQLHGPSFATAGSGRRAGGTHRWPYTENLAAIAEMSEGADAAHVAAHIRGMVAATMGHLSVDAPTMTRNNAEQWQDWALGVADGVAQTVPAAV